MARSHRPDLEEELEEATDERAADPAPKPAAPQVAAVLRMQSLVGNHATSRMVAAMRVAREPAEAVPADSGPQAAGKESAMTLAGFDRYSIGGYSLSGKTAVSVVFDPGKDAARLMEASSKGQRIPTVTITTGTRTITLTDVIIASFQHANSGGEPLISLELDAASITLE